MEPKTRGPAELQWYYEIIYEYKNTCKNFTFLCQHKIWCRQEKVFAYVFAAYKEPWWKNIPYVHKHSQAFDAQWDMALIGHFIKCQLEGFFSIITHPYFGSLE